MKFKCGECLLLALFMFFIELIKRCCPLPSSIQMVDPLIIKINIEKFENISLIILLNYTTENRSRKKLILQFLGYGTPVGKFNKYLIKLLVKKFILKKKRIKIKLIKEKLNLILFKKILSAFMGNLIYLI